MRFPGDMGAFFPEPLRRISGAIPRPFRAIQDPWGRHMSFRLRKEWIDQEDGIQSVHLHYDISP